MGALTDTAENKEIDFKFRAQAYGRANATAAAGSGPSSWFIGLLTTAPTESTGGVEVAGPGYARVQVACSLANWAGTQGAGTTTVSSGSSGTTSNNGTITFPQPTGDWGNATSYGAWDSATGGILEFHAPLNAPVTIGAGNSPPSFAPGTLTFRIDD